MLAIRLASHKRAYFQLAHHYLVDRIVLNYPVFRARKYVRKPRKSPPGAVVPDRVKTLFVEPDPDRIRRMKEDGPDAP